MKTYVVASHLNSLGETVLMMVTTYVFIEIYGELHLNYPFYPFLFGALLLVVACSSVSFEFQPEDLQQQIIRETFHLVSKRDDNVCNFLEGGT